MAGITLETAQKQLDLWIAAEEKVTNGQSYKIGNRELTYADLSDIASRIDYWQNKINTLLQAGKGRNRLGHFVPRDL